jgi:hypothetical protein
MTDDPLTDEEAKVLLERLRRHFREPVLPVSKYCEALRTWAGAAAQGYDHENRIVSASPGEIQDVFLAIRKSNLLWRLIYLGEPLRTIKCPTHEGRWSGCDGFNRCACSSGHDITGWLPTPP